MTYIMSKDNERLGILFTETKDGGNREVEKCDERFPGCRAVATKLAPCCGISLALADTQCDRTMKSRLRLPRRPST